MDNDKAGQVLQAYQEMNPDPDFKMFQHANGQFLLAPDDDGKLVTITNKQWHQLPGDVRSAIYSLRTTTMKAMSAALGAVPPVPSQVQGHPPAPSPQVQAPAPALPVPVAPPAPLPPVGVGGDVDQSATLTILQQQLATMQRSQQQQASVNSQIMTALSFMAETMTKHPYMLKPADEAEEPEREQEDELEDGFTFDN